MKIAVANFHNHGSVKSRLNCSDHCCCFLIPQFKLTAIMHLPVFVQVNYHGKTPGELDGVIKCCINMHIELTASGDNAVTRAMKIRIREKVPDTCRFRKKI